MKKRGSEGGTSGGIRIDGKQQAADLLKHLDEATRNRIMGELDQRQPGLTTELKRRMFLFEDLVRLEPEQLRKAFQAHPETLWVLALRNASPALLAALEAALPTRLRERLFDDVRAQGPKALSDVRAAQAKIIDSLS